MKRTIAVVLLFSTILTTGFAQKKSGEEYSAQAKKGVIPAWEKGYLDIHFISTVTGESTFIIMPDGTQMLVDRGWPDYSYPLDMTGSKSMQCYHKCVKYHMQNGMQVERFKTGYDDQFVMKSDHHGSSDSNHDYFVRTLSPQAVILTVWRNVQPKGGLQKYLNDNVNGGMTDLFSTSLDMGLEEKLGSGAARILSKEGHLVVRVNPGGESYYIYSLSDNDESMNINERFGPYKSR